MKKQTRADLMLIIVTFCWGVSYLMLDIALREIGPMTLNAYRFLGAFILLGIGAFPLLKKVNKTTIRYSIYIGISLYVAYTAVTFGVMYTSLSNAGFLCALTVVITPVLELIFKKKVPHFRLILAVILSLIGIGLLTLNSEFKLAWGDILCIICAFAYSVDMIITETAVRKEEVNAFQIGVFQLFFCGALSLITALFTETITYPKTLPVWGAVIFLSIICTGVAMVVQALAQQHTTASHVGVIFTLEPVFAGIIAFVFAGEVLTPKAYLGAVILLSSILVLELNMDKIFSKIGIKKQ